MPGADEQSGRRQSRKGDGGRQCLATANFLLSWRVAGAIVGLETEVMFSDTGSKDPLDTSCERGWWGQGRCAHTHTHAYTHTCIHTHAYTHVHTHTAHKGRCATGQDPGS